MDENIGLSNHVDRLETNEIPDAYLYDDISIWGFDNVSVYFTPF